jgi:hypothetical protein
VVIVGVVIALIVGGGDGSSDEDSTSPPTPAPGFYLTAASAEDLRRQAYDSAARFAREQGPEHSILALDFGAARLKGDDYGSALRGGTFFTNDEIESALQSAARGYHDNYRRGSVTIVYANSNAYLGRPGKGFKAFDEDTAREAGERQADVVSGLDLESNESAAVGGDIEPGYDIVAPPEVPIALVAGAADGASGDYYDFGTAPCKDGRCVNGWTVQDVCEVASGSGRAVLPEIYFDVLIDQPGQWAEVQKTCDIDRFAGVSSSPIGRLTPKEAWRALGERTSTDVDPVIVVFPG